MVLKYYLPGRNDKFTCFIKPKQNKTKPSSHGGWTKIKLTFLCHEA